MLYMYNFKRYKIHSSTDQKLRENGSDFLPSTRVSGAKKKRV